MKKNKVILGELIAFLGENVIRVYGNPEGVFIDHLADVKHVDETTLDWINASNPAKQEIAEASRAHVLLVDKGVTYTECMKDAGKVLLVVSNPKRCLAEVGNHFFVKRHDAGIHPTAIVDVEASIGENVCIGPYAVVGKAIIGDRTVIDSNVRVYDDVVLGKNCKIKAGAVLGGEGFGFETDPEGNKFRFPQVGSLIIGDDVEVGANTCIDRGALSDTIIGDHTKINNLCHIAHNNQIGKNVVIAGCVNVSGSCVIGDNVWISPNVSLRGFNHLGEGCTVGTGAVVTKDIPSGETWVGNPARKLVK